MPRLLLVGSSATFIIIVRIVLAPGVFALGILPLLRLFVLTVIIAAITSQVFERRLPQPVSLLQLKFYLAFFHLVCFQIGLFL